MSEPATVPRFIYPAFLPGQMVTHVADELARGAVVAFMVRGKNHSYQVAWGIERCEWYQEFELRQVPDAPQSIGFWYVGKEGE